MPINITLMDKQDNYFPKLMKARMDGEIVYFLKEREGISLSPNSDRSHILYKEWVMAEFEDYNGSVILENR